MENEEIDITQEELDSFLASIGKEDVLPWSVADEISLEGFGFSPKQETEIRAEIAGILQRHMEAG